MGYLDTAQDQAKTGLTTTPRTLDATSDPTLASSVQAKSYQQGVSPQAVTSWQMEQLTSKDSPLMERARQSGYLTAGTRGLQNTSIAAGMAEGEMVDRMTPIAQSNAQTYLTQALANQQESGLTERSNVSELNRMSALNMAAENERIAQLSTEEQQRYLQERGITSEEYMQGQAITSQEKMQLEDIVATTERDIAQFGYAKTLQSMTEAQQRYLQSTDIGAQNYRDAQAYSHEAQMADKQISAQRIRDNSMQLFELNMQTLKGEQSVQLANIDALHKQLLQTNDSAARIYESHQSAIANINDNHELTATEKTVAIRSQIDALEASLNVIGGIAGLDLSGYAAGGGGTGGTGTGGTGGYTGGTGSTTAGSTWAYNGAINPLTNEPMFPNQPPADTEVWSTPPPGTTAPTTPPSDSNFSYVYTSDGQRFEVPTSWASTNVNPYVAGDAGGQGTTTWPTTGWTAEDTAAYLAQYPDVATGWDGTAEEHYNYAGANEIASGTRPPRTSAGGTTGGTTGTPTGPTGTAGGGSYQDADIVPGDTGGFSTPPLGVPTHPSPPEGSTAAYITEPPPTGYVYAYTDDGGQYVVPSSFQFDPTENYTGPPAGGTGGYTPPPYTPPDGGGTTPPPTDGGGTTPPPPTGIPDGSNTWEAADGSTVWGGPDGGTYTTENGTSYPSMPVPGVHFGELMEGAVAYDDSPVPSRTFPDVPPPEGYKYVFVNDGGRFVVPLNYPTQGSWSEGTVTQPPPVVEEPPPVVEEPPPVVEEPPPVVEEPPPVVEEPPPTGGVATPEQIAQWEADGTTWYYSTGGNVNQMTGTYSQTQMDQMAVTDQNWSGQGTGHQFTEAENQKRLEDTMSYPGDYVAALANSPNFFAQPLSLRIALEPYRGTGEVPEDQVHTDPTWVASTWGEAADNMTRALNEGYLTPRQRSDALDLLDMFTGDQMIAYANQLIALNVPA